MGVKKFFGSGLKIFVSIFLVAFLFHMIFYWFMQGTEISGIADNQRLNNYLPEYDFTEKHEIVIHSSPDKVFEAIHNLDMSKSKTIKTLLSLRSIYSRLNPGREPKNQSPPRLTIEELIKEGGFFLLEEVENQEVVIGLAGKFWQPSGGMVKLIGANDFISFNQTSYAKSAWNFYIEQNTDDTVTLSTETRILCLGGQAKSSFCLYWTAIRPYSGWIRLEMLKMIKEQAEGKTLN